MDLSVALATTNPTQLLAIGIPGGFEWVIVLVIILLLFGHRLPGMARSLGSGITEFRKGLKNGEDDPKRVEGADGMAQQPSSGASTTRVDASAAGQGGADRSDQN